MIRPTYFGFNPETASSNAFQKDTDLDPAEVRAKAIEEWEGLAAALEAHGIEVIQFDDTPEPHTPDACFPNNWISCHADGTIVLYPMMPANRRMEYRQDIVDYLRTLETYKGGRILDLRHHAEEGRFLEGTGSLVLDRTTRTAYAALSARTHLSVAEEWAREMDYELVAFHAQDVFGAEVYHTNVMMSVGEGFVLACLESLACPDERARVEGAFGAAGLEVISFKHEQLGSFVGNSLQLKTLSGGLLTVSSSAGYEALNLDQRRSLEELGGHLRCDLSTIEFVGGGSARCGLCEIPTHKDLPAGTLHPRKLIGTP